MQADQLSTDEIFAEALCRPQGSERDSYLDEALGRDTPARQRIDKLLRAHADAGSFLESPALSPPHFGEGLGEVLSDTQNQSPDSCPERPGTIIGPYKLLQQIGEGGMGVVFLAEQTEPVRRQVALKIIKPGMDTRQVIARFEAERQALAMMDHPNIARVLDAGTTSAAGSLREPSPKAPARVGEGGKGGRGEPDLQASSPVSPSPPLPLSPSSPGGRPYFVMDLVKGVPITDYCDQNRLTVSQRLALFTQVCHAVQHAHQKGIIHRDLKPSNVLVAEYDGKPVPKVIDFGVAKATAQRLTERTMFTQYGQIVGTFEYMSPEQAHFNQLDVDTRSDIYSLGVLLYELLTGSTPFEKQRLETTPFDETLRIIREEEPPKPSTRISSLSSRKRAIDSLPLAGRVGEGVPSSLATIAANRGLEPGKLTSVVRGELDWIVMKALEKDRNRRYETAAELASDLTHFLRDEPITAAAPSQLYRTTKFVRRNKVLVIASAAVLAGLIVGIIGTSIGLVSQSRQRAIAERERNQAQLNLATAFHSQENFAEAERLYRDALAATGDSPDDRQRTARTLLRLASIVGTWGESEQLYHQAIDAHREAFPPGDPSLAHALQTYGLVLRNGGRPADAEPLLREAYEIRRKAQPADHYSTGSSASYLGDILRRLGRNAEAEPMCRVAIAEYQLHSPPPEKLIAFARLGLGSALVTLGRRSEAEAEMLAAARTLESDPEHIFGESALAWLYMTWDLAEPGKGYDAKFREWTLKSMGQYMQPPLEPVEATESK
jgi:serine/threonine protein kinase